MKNALGIVCLMLFLFSCKKNKLVNGYSYHTNGFYYKIITIGDGAENPGKQHVVVLDAVMRTQNDSVFWDTSHDAPNGLYLDLGQTEKIGEPQAYFTKMVEGDSVSFMIPTKIFFRLFFDTIAPNFCKYDSLIKLDVKLLQIISRNEYHAIQQSAEGVEVEDVELQELQRIDSYLMKDYKNIIPDENGIYVLEKTLTNNIPVTSGKKIKVEYQGFFIDGKPLDNTPQVIEFIYGTPDQLIKGLNIVIASLKKGETAKIILPSRLAFGENGSSNGSVPPFTPLLFKIKIIEIQ